ncbi:hypothetical protein HDU97_006137 [Phlyctochytrium planicorne]|nr:hypothetical protein HDU97_006137 [Phlyctochytrium planicorne]
MKPPANVGSIKLKLSSSTIQPGTVLKGWLYMTLTEAIHSTGPVACDVVGLACVGWVGNANPGYGSPTGERVGGEVEIWRQRIDLAPPQDFTAGEHAYEIIFPLPEAMTPTFNHTDPFTFENMSVRYIIEGSLQGYDEDPFRVSSAISESLSLIHPPTIPQSLLSAMHSAQTASRVSVKMHCNRDRWRARRVNVKPSPGDEATVFVTCKNGSDRRVVRLLAVEVLQRTSLWTFAYGQGGQAQPLARDYTRVVARVDLPPVPPSESFYVACKVALPEGLPPTISVQGMEVLYEVSVVAVIGGDEHSNASFPPAHIGGVSHGGGLEVRCTSEVIVVGPHQEIEIPGPVSIAASAEGETTLVPWDDVDEEALMTQRVVEAAVAQVKKMALETQAEYQARVKLAEDAAVKAIEEADARVRVKEEEAEGRVKAKEEEAAARIKEKEQEAEAIVKAKEAEAVERIKQKEEEAARILREKEEEKKKLLVEKDQEKTAVEGKLRKAEEENAMKLKAAEEAAAAAKAAAAEAKKSSMAALTNHPVLPNNAGVGKFGGKLLESAGLISTKATPVQMDAMVKDSAFYQLFKLFYFDILGDKIDDMKKNGLVPGVVVFANAAAAVRVSRNAVPNLASFDLKEESVSKAGENQEEYVVRLTLGPGRYYIAVYGRENPLVMTQFSLMIRKMPLTLTMEAFSSLWRPMMANSSPNNIPWDALTSGKDLDGKPLYTIRAKLQDGSLRIGHMGRHMKSPVVIGPNGKPLVLPATTPYEVLMQTPGLRFVEQLTEGSIPPNAVPGGVEADGRKLYIARAAIQGKSINILQKLVVPGEAGHHLKGARVVAKGGLGILVAALETQSGVVPFDVLVFQTASSGENPYVPNKAPPTPPR